MAARMIFVNLAVKDLAKSVAFFTELGFGFNPQFTNEKAACMVLNDGAYVMLLADDFFKSFTAKDIADTATSVETLLAVSAASREEVDDLVHKALAAGGKPAGDPLGHGFMYGWSFQDLDGHVWEPVWMDPAAIGGS
ncbi:MAG: VOC family protein [Actinomycetota bacterium]|nr:VOC family protein [Actinomycetota bacterium]